MIRRLILLHCVSALVTSIPSPAQQDEREPKEGFSYSARFYCSMPRDGLLPGDCGDNCWDTEIALSNPGRREANATIWAVEARPISQSPPPTRSAPAIELSLARPTMLSASAVVRFKICYPPRNNWGVQERRNPTVSCDSKATHGSTQSRRTSIMTRGPQTRESVSGQPSI